MSVKTKTFWPFCFLLALLVVTFFVFSPALKNQFVNWDDPTHFLDLQHIRSLTFPHIKDIFTEHINATYIPLTTLSFALEYHFVTYNPFVFHLNNILLHLFVVALAFFFLRRLGLSALVCYAAVCLFAVHPMKVESVAWVTERKDVLYASFYLLALHSYISFIKQRKIFFYVLAGLFGILSMLAKPMALSLPLILLLLDWYDGPTNWKQNILEKLPFFAYVFFLARLTQAQNSDAFAIDGTIGQSILIFIWTFSAYLWKFMVPLSLTPLYQLPEPIRLSNFQYMAAICVFCLFFGLVWTFRRNKTVIFSILFYLLSMFFLLRVNKIYNVDVIADRFLYLPGLGLCIVFGMIVDELSRRKGRPVLWAVLGIIFSLLMSKTYQQCTIWKDSLTLWNHVLKHEPAAVFAYNNRGIVYEEQGKLDLSLADYNKTIEIIPAYIKTYIHRGIIYGKMGEYDMALQDLTKVIASHPDWNALNNRGNIYQMQKRYQLAIDDYNAAIQYNPHVETIYDNRGASYTELGQYQDALKDFNTAISLNPEYVNSYVNRGLVMEKLARYDEAMTNYNQALQIDPNMMKSWVRRATLYKQLGKLDAAIADYTKAISLAPQWSELYNNRGIIYGMKEEYDKAFEDINRSIEINPENASAYVNRAMIYKLRGDLTQSGEDIYRANMILQRQKK